MRNKRTYFPVNWIDGMKINKTHFIGQDNAYLDAIQEVASLNLSPIKFGILPPSFAGEENFNVKISLDNQESIRISVLSCQAITPGGVTISIPVPTQIGEIPTGNDLTSIFPFVASAAEAVWWIFLFIG